MRRPSIRLWDGHSSLRRPSIRLWDGHSSLRRPFICLRDEYLSGTFVFGTFVLERVWDVRRSTIVYLSIETSFGDVILIFAKVIGRFPCLRRINI